MSIQDEGRQVSNVGEQHNLSQVSSLDAGEETLQNLFEVLSYNNPDDTSNDASPLIRKIAGAMQMAWLRIDGQSPKLQVRQYLTDNQPIIFDFSQLSPNKREQIMAWFKDDPQSMIQAKRKRNFSYRLTERRGLPEMRPLTTWDKFKQLFSRGRFVYQLRSPKKKKGKPSHIDSVELSFNQRSMLVNLKQKGKISELMRREYELDDNYIDTCGNRNHKRLTFTDNMVDELCRINFDDPHFDIGSYLQAKNRFSINATENTALRRKRMLNERMNLGYVKKRKPSIYKRFFKGVSAQFSRLRDWVMNKSPKPKLETPRAKIANVYSNDSLKIMQNVDTGEVHLYEQRDFHDELTIVFNGGGAKFPGHVGALQALIDAGLVPKRFGGSSAGAIMAFLAFLGYSRDEIESIVQYLNKKTLLEFDLTKKGLYNSNLLRTALLQFLLKKITPVIEENASKFSGQFCDRVLKGQVSYDDLTEIKKQVPNCCLGDHLMVTMTNKDTGQNEYASHTHNSHLDVLETVLASASFPVFIHSTEMKLCNCDDKTNCSHQSNRYTDGGLTKNLPLDNYRDAGHGVIKHEYGASLNVLAFVFDNGIEEDIIYKDGKGVYRESMFSDFFTYLFTNVMPGSKWVEERKRLREQAGQAILIKVPKHIGATDFNISQKDRDQLVKNGYDAAKAYLTNHPVAEGDEYLHKSFESVEELLVYCAYRGKWDLLEDIYQQFNIHDLATGEISNIHSKLYKRLQKYTHQDNDQQPQPHPEPVAPVEDELNKDSWKKQVKRSELFTLLYPVLIQPLDEIFASLKSKAPRLYRPEFKRALSTLDPENPKESLEALISCFKLIGKETHFLTQVLQTIVVACMSIEKIAEHILDMLAQLPTVISTCLRDEDLMGEDYWGCFEFDEGDCLELMQGVQHRKLDEVKLILVEKAVSDDVKFIDNPLYEDDSKSLDKGVDLVNSTIIDAPSTLIGMNVSG